MGLFDSLFGRKEPEPELPRSPLAAALERWNRAGRPAEQVTALEGLAAVGGPEAVAVFKAALQSHSSVHAQIAAARLLGESGDPEAAALLEKVAGEAFWAESRAARSGGSGVDVGDARRAAQADEKLVRQACENALKKLKGA